MELGEFRLKTSLASIGYKQASGMEMGVNAMSMFAGAQSSEFEESRVLQLLNMVTAEELIDNDEYEGKYNPMRVWSLNTNIQSRNLRRHSGRVLQVWRNP